MLFIKQELKYFSLIINRKVNKSLKKHNKVQIPNKQETQKRIVSNKTMDQNNYFLQESQIDGSYQLRVKIKYLQDDKEKLEISNDQMKQNIKLLREINKELSKSNTDLQCKELVEKLTAQNTVLQSCYIRILDQNKALTCRNLMLEQIIQETQIQQREILRGYETKIIELRRSIQFKESCIQSYQQNANSNSAFEIPNIPPSNLSMVFFNEIDEYKNKIYELQAKNKRLQNELQTSKRKINTLETEKNFLNSMMQSRQGFNQLRKRINQNKLSKRTQILSQGKLPSTDRDLLSLKSDKNLNNKKKQSDSVMKKGEKSTCTSNNAQQVSYQNTGNYKFNQLKEQLRKSNLQLCKMAKGYKKEHEKRKENDEKIRILLNSNKFYKQKRETNTDELNYYKKSTLDLLKVVQKRKVKNSYSLQKTQIQNMIKYIKKPTDLSNFNKLKFWKSIQSQLNSKLSQKSETQLKSINQKQLKKSFSDVFDYASINNPNKNSFQKTQNVSKYQGEKKRQVQDPSTNFELDDFSRILTLGANGDAFSDQTFIIKPKMNLAERKKMKTNLRNAHSKDLTIIAENIL